MAVVVEEVVTRSTDISCDQRSRVEVGKTITRDDRQKWTNWQRRESLANSRAS